MSRRRPYAPRMPPAERREQVLDAALAVIVRDGYPGISIEAIAREAGISRPVVYGVFAGLGPLLYALLDRQEKRALSRLLSALPDPGPDRSFDLAGTVRRLAEVVRDDPDTWRPILAPAAETPETVRRRIEGDRELVRIRIENLVLNELPPAARESVDTEVISHALIAVAEHFGRLLIEEPDRFEPERLVDALVAMLPPGLGRAAEI